MPPPDGPGQRVVSVPQAPPATPGGSVQTMPPPTPPVRSGPNSNDGDGSTPLRWYETSSNSPRRRLLTGGLLLLLASLGGVFFSYRPAPTFLDRWADSALPSEWSLHYLTYITDLGRPRVVVPGAVVCFIIAVFWDRRRALTCLIAPALAIGITEYIAKPLVGRTYGGSLSYPSGHMTSVAAIVTVFVIAVPPRWRWPAAVAGVAVDIVVGATLILLRWHFLTDVLAGAAVAIGTTLIVDAVLHIGAHNPPRRHAGNDSDEWGRRLE